MTSQTTTLALRQVLSQFATGVTVVTAITGNGTPLGMTVSSFNSVSLDPPLILFSLSRRAPGCQTLLTLPFYAVNVLSHKQADLSGRFATAGIDKWQGVNWHRGDNGAPLLDGAIASFECRVHRHDDGGDHIIFLSEVLRHRHQEQDEPPLVFFRGGYHGIAPVNLRR
ncbi:flavin reductase family protein [Izhakiella australiensis]|uniref:flavin reductase family protein n=1 Tax=Izhakiella australiensis TaxID=1926881 RepID=UPI0018E06581|nr:flavin reductase family protein [Izhakiella australiensis]